jgi:hypothetical protein
MIWLMFFAAIALTRGQDVSYTDTRIIKIASVVYSPTLRQTINVIRPQLNTDVTVFDAITPGIQKGIVCVQQLWADMWNEKSMDDIKDHNSHSKIS